VWSLAVEGGIVARARAEELREVLLNVLENSRLARARRVDVRAMREPGRVVVTVQDDGDGIPKDVMPRIFEPRFSTRTSGSGLGLAISRRLVDGWGGDIAVASERGRGTVVTISLLAVRSLEDEGPE
jgi:signal transduction histidine kinase